RMPHIKMTALAFSERGVAKLSGSNTNNGTIPPVVGAVFRGHWMARRSIAMDRQTQVPVEQYRQRMQEEVDRVMQQVMEAVNAAPDGRWINGSEVQVRDVMAEFRRKA